MGLPTLATLSHLANRYQATVPRPTAAVIFSAGALLLVQKYLPEVGLLCPEDISLVCKADERDKIDAASLRGDAVLLGQRAVDLLLERAQGKRLEPQRVALSTTLRRGPTVRILPG